jgi:hypothetical protein
LEAVNGVLLFGISTAFLASVITEARNLLGRLTGRPRTNALPIA